jgi:hypothetical protein
MHKNAMKCNKILSKWCKNKHGASKIIDTFETYQPFRRQPSTMRDWDEAYGEARGYKEGDTLVFGRSKRAITTLSSVSPIAWEGLE